MTKISHLNKTLEFLSKEAISKIFKDQKRETNPFLNTVPIHNDKWLRESYPNNLFTLTRNDVFKDWIYTHINEAFLRPVNMQETEYVLGFPEQERNILLCVALDRQDKIVSTLVNWYLICKPEDNIKQAKTWDVKPINLALFFEKVSQEIFKESLPDNFWNQTSQTIETKNLLDQEKWERDLPVASSPLSKKHL